MDIERESDLYGPVKAFLEAQGYAVKGEVDSCDVVGVRGEEEPVIVELKRAFTLELLIQGVERLKLTSKVYVAVPMPDGRRRAANLTRRRRGIIRLCRMLGLGLILVRPGRRPRVEVELDPVPYRPRIQRRRREVLLKEFAHRIGDPNTGGGSRRPLVTAYRQDALRCAHLLSLHGPMKLSRLRELSGVARAARILQKDVYGWFQRIGHGVYEVSPRGRRSLEKFASVVAALG